MLEGCDEVGAGGAFRRLAEHLHRPFESNLRGFAAGRLHGCQQIFGDQDSRYLVVEAKRRRQIELQRIAGALRRIEDGEYGDCLRCGEPIAEKRLLARPASSSCVECKKSFTQEV